MISLTDDENVSFVCWLINDQNWLHASVSEQSQTKAVNHLVTSNTSLLGSYVNTYAYLHLQPVTEWTAALNVWVCMWDVAQSLRKRKKGSEQWCVVFLESQKKYSQDHERIHAQLSEYVCCVSIRSCSTNENVWIVCFYPLVKLHLFVWFASVVVLVCRFLIENLSNMTTAASQETTVNEEYASSRDDRRQRYPSTNSSTPNSSGGEKQFQFTNNNNNEQFAARSCRWTDFTLLS